MQMKRILIVLLVIISVVNINAEETFSFQTNPILYFNPVLQNLLPSIAFGVKSVWEPSIIIIDIEFQYKLNKKFTLSINPTFAQGFWKYYWINGDMNVVDSEYYSSNCLNLAAGLLYRPFGTGLRGMYLGAFSIIGWGYVTHGYVGDDSEKIADFLNLGFIMEIGYEWIFKNGFTITLGAGITKLFQIPKVSIITAVNAYYNDYYDYGNLYGLGSLPIDPRLRVSIGYSF
jgi:hypothetical protein